MKPGGVLHTSKPYVHAIFPSERGKRCEQCMVSGEDQGIHLKKCTQCTVVHYCSTECQRKDWIFHKLECKCFKRAAPWIPSEAVMLHSRLFQRHNRDEHITVSETICGRKVVFNDLVHHVEDIKQDENRMREFNKIKDLLQIFLGGRLAFPTTDDMLKMYGRLQVNNFCCTIDDEAKPIGVAVFLGLSAIDHSCRPNAVVAINGDTARLRTIIDVPDNALETYCNEIRISYLDQMSLTEERRSILKKRYYFTCDCRMCSDMDMDAMMQIVKCPQPNCDGPMIRQEADQAALCTMCNTKFSNNSDVSTNYRSLLATTKSALLALDTLKENRHFEELFNKAEELLKLQGNTLHKMNVYRVKTLTRAADGAAYTKRYKKASEYALATLDAYIQYFEEYNPNVGALLMKIGAFQLHNGQLNEAYASLQHAQTILAVTLGSRCKSCKLVKEKLDECFRMLNLQCSGC